MEILNFTLEVLYPYRFSQGDLNNGFESGEVSESAINGLVKNSLGYYFKDETKVIELDKPIKLKNEKESFVDVMTSKRTIRNLEGVFNKDKTNFALTHLQDNFRDVEKYKTLENIFKSIIKKIPQNTVTNYISFKERVFESDVDVYFFLKHSPYFIKKYDEVQNDVVLVGAFLSEFISSKICHYYNTPKNVVNLMPNSYEISIKILKHSKDEIKASLLNPARPLNIGKKRAMVDITIKE